MAPRLTEPHRAEKNPIIFRYNGEECRFPDEGLWSRDPGPPGGEPRRGPAEPRPATVRRRGVVVILILVLVVVVVRCGGGAIQKAGLDGGGFVGPLRGRWCGGGGGGGQFPQRG